MRQTTVLALVLSLIGLCVMTGGIALIYPPAALIFSGAIFAYFGLLGIDVDSKSKSRKRSGSP